MTTLTEPSPDRTRLYLYTAALLSLVALILSLSNWPGEISGDCAMYLRCGQLLCQGKLPYVDFIDLNPPLIMYFNVIPAYLSNLLAIKPITSFCVVAAIFSALLLALTAKILWASNYVEAIKLRGPLILAGAIAVLVSQLWCQYGQREYFLGLTLTAFIFLRWLRWNDDAYKLNFRLAFSCGAAFALTLCFKPYFLLTIGLLELFWLWQKRKINPIFQLEIAGAIVAGLLYLLHFLFIPHNVSQAFFERVLPLVMAGYSAYSYGLGKLLFFPVFYGLVPMAVIAVVIMVAGRKKSSLFIPVLLWYFSAALIWIYQDKGWLQQLLTVMFASCYLIAIACSLTFKRPSNTALSMIFLVALCVSPYIWITDVRGKHYLGKGIESLIEKETAPGDNILIVSWSTNLLTQLVTTNRGVASRYFFLYPTIVLPELQANAKTQAERQKWLTVEKYFLNELAGDIAERKPTLLIINMPFGTTEKNTKVEWLKERGFWQEHLSQFKFIGIYDSLDTPLGVWKLAR